VSSLDRLSRNVATIEGLMSDGLLVWDVGGRLSREGDWDATLARKAEAQPEKLRASIAKSNSRTGQHKRVKNDNLASAQRRGTIANMANADILAETLAAVLAQVDPGSDLTKAEVAQLLNHRGILTRRGKAWTTSTVRRPLDRARILMAEQMTDDC
jgi:hypothetical protein